LGLGNKRGKSHARACCCSQRRVGSSALTRCASSHAGAFIAQSRAYGRVELLSSRENLSMGSTPASNPAFFTGMGAADRPEATIESFGRIVSDFFSTRFRPRTFCAAARTAMHCSAEVHTERLSTSYKHRKISASKNCRYSHPYGFGEVYCCMYLIT
jgi:hypothetical protein